LYCNSGNWGTPRSCLTPFYFNVTSRAIFTALLSLRLPTFGLRLFGRFISFH
jgi:hypothetical protein